MSIRWPVTKYFYSSDRDPTALMALEAILEKNGPTIETLVDLVTFCACAGQHSKLRTYLEQLEKITEVSDEDRRSLTRYLTGFFAIPGQAISASMIEPTNERIAEHAARSYNSIAKSTLDLDLVRQAHMGLRALLSLFPLNASIQNNVVNICTSLIKFGNIDSLRAATDDLTNMSDLPSSRPHLTLGDGLVKLAALTGDPSFTIRAAVAYETAVTYDPRAASRLSDIEAQRAFASGDLTKVASFAWQYAKQVMASDVGPSDLERAAVFFAGWAQATDDPFKRILSDRLSRAASLSLGSIDRDLAIARALATWQPLTPDDGRIIAAAEKLILQQPANRPAVHLAAAEIYLAAAVQEMSQRKLALAATRLDLVEAGQNNGATECDKEAIASLHTDYAAAKSGIEQRYADYRARLEASNKAAAQRDDEHEWGFRQAASATKPVHKKPERGNKALYKAKDRRRLLNGQLAPVPGGKSIW